MNPATVAIEVAQASAGTHRETLCSQRNAALDQVADVSAQLAGVQVVLERTRADRDNHVANAERLQTELTAERDDNRRLRAELLNAQKEIDTLKDQLAAKTPAPAKRSRKAKTAE